MNISNLCNIFRMAVAPACLKLFLEVHRSFRDDPNYNLRRMMKFYLGAMKGEKILRVNGHYLISSFIPPVPSRAYRTMLYATQEGSRRFSQQALLKRTAPISFYLALTGRCNYNCVHCSIKGRTTGLELSTQEWKQVIGDLQNMGTSIIGFTGGEPLLRDDLEELVSCVDDRSICYVFTNGHSLTCERARALKNAGLFGIGISLDSPDPGTNDKIRGHTGASASALTAMENAHAAGLHVMAQTVVAKTMLNKENRPELLKLFKLVKAHGAAEVRLLEPICSGKLLGTSDADDIFYSAEDRESMKQLQEEINHRFGYPKITAFAHMESAERYGCGAGNQHSYISPDGQLFPCDFVPLSFGSVRERSICELWKEMNDAVGIPKSECFAMKLNAVLRERSKTGFPVPREESEAICAAEKSDEYPGFFRALQ